MRRSSLLFRSRTSSTRNRAILYVGITDGSVDTAVALLNANRRKLSGGQQLNFIVRWQMEEKDTKISKRFCTISSIMRVRLKLMEC